jgi:hypothetical protein
MDGTKAAKLVDTSDTSPIGLESTKISATAGTTYVAFANVYVLSGSADLYVRFYNSTDVYLGGAYQSVSSLNQWATLQTTATAPANTAKVSVLLYSAKTTVGTAYWDNVLISTSFTSLGVQTYDSSPNGTTFGIGSNQDKIYSVIAGSSGNMPKMQIIDVDTEAVTTSITFPSNSTLKGAWAGATATDGNVYFGTYENARLYKHTPGTSTLTDLGMPISGVSVIFSMAAGDNGKVYGGTYDDAVLFKYQPSPGFAQIDTRPFAAGKEYIRALAYDTDHDVIYAGLGTNAAVYRFDIVTQEKTNILPAGYEDITGMPGSLDYSGGRLFVGLGSTKLVLNVQENPDGSLNSVTVDSTFSTSSLASPARNGKVYHTFENVLYRYDIATKTNVSLSHQLNGKVRKFEWVTLDDQTNYPGETLVGLATNENSTYIMKYNPQNNKFRFAPVSGSPQIPSGINMVSVGPEGKIYTSGFLTGGMGVYNPLRGDGNDATSDMMFKGISQVDRMEPYNGKMYFGVYPGGNLYEYDPTLPWDYETNPKQLVNTSAFKQDRPKAIAFGGGKVYMGTVATTGQMDGALTVYDLATGVSSTHTGIVNDQSIISLAYENGKLYGGSTIRPGYSSTPTQTEAKLFRYDPATNAKLNEYSFPVAGIKSASELTIVDGKIWGLADGYLFIFNPVTNTFEYFQEKFTGHSYSGGTYVQGTLLTVSKDPNNVYGTIVSPSGSKTLFKVNKSTKAVTSIATPTGAADKLTADEYGNLYYKGTETELWRYAF